MLSALIYKLFSQRYYIKNIGISPSGGLFSQTHSLVLNIKHDPTLTCVITHTENSHVTCKDVNFAPSCTDAEYCGYTIHVESSYLGYCREYSIKYKNDFPECATPYFMLAGLFDLKKQFSFFIFFFQYIKNVKCILNMLCFRISRDMLVLLRWWCQVSF